MGMNTEYAIREPTRAEVEAMPGPTLVEFGAPWCGYCIASQPMLATALGNRPAVRHLKIEDGRRRPLGRSFGVRLWPTLVFLHDGREVARLVRPADPQAIEDALDAQERAGAQVHERAS